MGVALTRRRAAGFVLAGCCGTLLGVGLQRFAYAPLLPAMIERGWVTPAEAGTLGAVNFTGYLFGAVWAPAIGRAMGMRTALRVAMLVAACGFLLCGLPAPSVQRFVWMLPWRAMAGVAGGVLMVLAGPAVQQAVPPRSRGRAAGVMFAGVGLGVIIGALLVPAMLPWGIASAWLALAALALGLAGIAWPCWPDVAAPPKLAPPGLSGRVGRLLASYACAAVAATPHMLFWPDFIARGLGWGADTGAAFWVFWGIGAASGPAIAGWLADRRGPVVSYRATLVVQLAAVLLPGLVRAAPALAAPILVMSSLMAGASAVGLTAVALSCARVLAPAAPLGVWRVGTAAYAAAQVLAGFGLTALLAASGSHLALFWPAVAAALVALVVWRPVRAAG